MATECCLEKFFAHIAMLVDIFYFVHNKLCCESYFVVDSLVIEGKLGVIEEDARYRPYRPVPRGLVTLRELGVVFAAAAVIQLALAIWYFPPLVFVLVVSDSVAAVAKEDSAGYRRRDGSTAVASRCPGCSRRR